MIDVVIFWFRRDLRLDDNIGLFHALQSSYPVLPIFIFDPQILKDLPEDDPRVTFIYQKLKQINKELNAHNSSLSISHDNPLQAFKKLIKQYNIKAVYTNHDYEPYALERDQHIANLLESHKIDFLTYKDHVIFEKDEIIKTDGTPYKVYTPYSKRWLSLYKAEDFKSLNSEDFLENFYKHLREFPDLKQLGFIESSQKIPLYKLSSSTIDSYEANRNYPSIKGTSYLGPHLRFGTLSIRSAVQQACRSNNLTFLKELIWRDFFIQILWHYPHTTIKSFKPKYDSIVWRNNQEEFQLWCDGKTGYPLVDAGMRELNATGFMHNRVRMVVASFLCKHLLIDWRWGEAYFAKKLHDFELASNVGNWQWVAGCGVDAAPYFRIFNPTTQLKTFDKDFVYVKKWVPEFQEFTYPKPIVEHTFARNRCLGAFQKALK